MVYRMLIGRQVLDNVTIDPNASFLQPSLSYELYRGLKKKVRAKRPLRIAILTREPNNYSCRRMVEAAEVRDHTVELIDTKRCYLNIHSQTPEVHYNGEALPYYDAVIPRIGASLTFYGMAVIRQFEAMGTYCVNSSTAIGASRDKLMAHQVLARHKVPMPTTAFANSPRDTKSLLQLVGGAPVIIKLLQSTQGKGVVLAETKKAGEAVVGAFQGLEAQFIAQEYVQEAAGEDLRCLVIGKRVVASMLRVGEEGEYRSNLHAGGQAKLAKISPAERALAVKVARILGLKVAGVDILRSNKGPKVIEVNSSPGLEGIEKVTGLDIATELIQHIEGNVPPFIGRVAKAKSNTTLMQP